MTGLRRKAALAKTLRWRRARRLAAGLLAAVVFAGSAMAESYRFTWVGAQGYRVEGAFALKAGADERAIVRAGDLRCFEIEGFHGEASLGGWRLGALTPDTAWTFGFDRAERRFLVGGLSYGPNGQQWNMFGDGSGCGPGGFGFNAGSAGQDVCVDNMMRVASRIAPGTPLTAQRDDAAVFSPGACHGADLVS